MTKFIECEYGQFVSVDDILTIHAPMNVKGLSEDFYHVPVAKISILISFKGDVCAKLYFSTMQKLEEFYAKIRALNAGGAASAIPRYREVSEIPRTASPQDFPPPTCKNSIKKKGWWSRKGAATKDAMLDDDDWGQKGI
jgi:hypothetical protein